MDKLIRGFFFSIYVDVLTFVIIPLLIFFARVMDVSIGTVRLIFISRGFKLLAPFLGFFEVLIWLLAIQQLFNNLTSPIAYVAYAAGFATGTLVGMMIEERISLGTVMVRVLAKDVKKLMNDLEQISIRVSSINERSMDGKMTVLLAIIRRQDLPSVISVIKKHNPYSFYSIEDVRFASEDHVTVYKRHQPLRKAK